MKPSARKLAWLMLLAILALGQPFIVWSRNQSDDESSPSIVAQNIVTLKWKYDGSDAGASTYQTFPDGRFESVTDLNIAGMAITSRLTGRLVDGAITEFEIVNSRGEVKVSAKDGKARITAGGETREVEYKPSKILIANLHPVLDETLVKAIDPAKEGAQSIEVFVLDSAATVKADVLKKKARAIETGGKKQIADVYLVRFPDVEYDVYLANGSQFAAEDVPSQKVQAIRTGYEAFLGIHPELSQPTMKTKLEKSVKIKMRDGIELVADIVRPAEDGKYPAILVRTPYGREGFRQGGERWARRDYVYIAQDVRGRNESDGEWNPYVHERKDGYDTIDWIARQSWSDGKVGMIGGSYGGQVQWAAAVEAHPALKCIVPQVSPPELFFNSPIDHGVPKLYNTLWWSNYVKEKKTPLRFPEIPRDSEKLKTLPLSKVDDEVLGHNIPFYDEWLGKETPASFADANFMADMNKVKIPVLQISGWWDAGGIGTKLNWAKMRALGHKDQWLIYGPWPHDFNSSSRFGDRDYGPDAIIDLDSIYLRWFDTWLKNKPVQWEKQPKVRAFVTGANEWRELGDWPDPRSREMTLYLSSKAPANGAASVGELVPAPPKDQEPDRYTYDPASARFLDLLVYVATVVKIEPDENSVLVYKTPPMKDPIEIGGPIDLDLYFSTSAKDTDFFASLVDIDEKGEMRMIGLPGKIRARYVCGWEKPALLQPGKVYQTTIALWDTAHRVKEGHRLGVLINSQMFPNYARNLNTGEPIRNATRMVAAHQTIYHDAKRPSALRFRLLPQAQKQAAGMNNRQ
jgi:uncharacterized protein